jgi:uncharacterized protein YuzE
VKIAYDRQTDSLSVILKEGVTVAESDEDKPGVILDYDEHRDLIALEILDASRRVTDARKIEYETTLTASRPAPSRRLSARARMASPKRNWPLRSRISLFMQGFPPAIGFSHRNDLYARHLNLPGAAH